MHQRPSGSWRRRLPTPPGASPELGRYVTGSPACAPCDIPIRHVDCSYTKQEKVSRFLADRSRRQRAGELPDEQVTKGLAALRPYYRMAADAWRLLPNAKGSPALRVSHWAAKSPAAPAIVTREACVSWQQTDEAASRYATWLSNAGIGPGDVVALMMDNRPEFLFALTALSRLGAIAALVNTQLRGDALLHAFHASASGAMVVGSEYLDPVLEVAGDLEGFVLDKDLAVQLNGPDADARGLPVIDCPGDHRCCVAPPPVHSPRNTDVCCYISTSGTTGLPKAAVIRNQRFLGGGFSFGHLMHRCGPGDLIYVALPLYHSSALFLGWGAALATGAAIGLPPKFSASAFWDDIREMRATSFLYIGELCRYLLAQPPNPLDGVHELRAAVGNGLRPDVWNAFQTRFRVPIIREFYGATEGNVPLLNLAGRPGMLGRRKRGQAVVRCDLQTGEPERDPQGYCRSVERGETGLLLGRISRLLSFDGYVDERASRKKVRCDVFKRGDRWFDTGDLVTLHDAGWLSFADRVGDTFRWKGENVSTQEVSASLGGARGVREAVVYGVEVPSCEGRVGMVALRLDGEFAPREFALHVRSALPDFQRPRFVRILDRPVETTSTFKQRSAAYRAQGYDPRAIHDKLFHLEGDRYVPLDEQRFDSIQRGDLRLN